MYKSSILLRNISWIGILNFLCIIQCSSSTSCHLQIALLDWKFEAVADWIFSSAGQYFHHYHWGCWGCWICFKRIKRPALEATAEMSNVKCVLIKRQNIYAMPDWQHRQQQKAHKGNGGRHGNTCPMPHFPAPAPASCILWTPPFQLANKSHINRR